ncbi:hypothetical protein V8E36_000506 [Tilletia maclaganii]
MLHAQYLLSLGSAFSLGGSDMTATGAIPTALPVQGEASMNEDVFGRIIHTAASEAVAASWQPSRSEKATTLPGTIIGSNLTRGAPRGAESASRSQPCRPRHSNSKATELKAPPALSTALQSAFGSQITPKDWQLRGAYMVAAGWDGLIAAGTGAGKSMLWVLLALLLSDANFLIITPMKAIQKEQVGILRRLKISAVAVNADTLSKPQRSKANMATSDVLSLIKHVKARVIFAAPETLISNPRVARTLCKGDWADKLQALIIDEAHTIYDWGVVAKKGSGPFRPSFGKIDLLRARFRDKIPVLAVSATLCGPTLPAVSRSLSLGRRPLFALDVGKERDGCCYDVQSFQHPATSFRDLIEILPEGVKTSKQLPKALVHVNSRALAHVGVQTLRAYYGSEFDSAFASFTADDTARQKCRTMENFKVGTARIVIATEALGMGIDLPDVDLVVQWQLPKDFKTMVQHFGRGARGPNSRALALLLCDSWIEKARTLCGTSDGHQLVGASKTQAQKWAALDPLMRSWLTDHRCWRDSLVSLLAIEFRDMPKSEASISISTDPLTHGEHAPAVKPCDDQARFFWRNSAPLPPAPICAKGHPLCCSKCHADNAVPRQKVAWPEAETITRLSVPPLRTETIDLRRDLGQKLIQWRHERYCACSSGHLWQSESTYISDTTICELADRAPRILAYIQRGHAITLIWMRALLGTSSDVAAELMGPLQDLLEEWASGHVADPIAQKLTPQGWLRRQDIGVATQGAGSQLIQVYSRTDLQSSYRI